VLEPGRARAGLPGYLIMLAWLSGALCGLLAGLILAAAVIL
jgi:hypothetical protein